MSKTDSKPTPERVRALLNYDKATGVLTWREARSQCRVGDVAGRLSDGYISIGVDDKAYRGHVLAFVIVNGRWPVSDIDHENGIGSDNRWTNLREVTHAVNMQNRQRANSNSTTGVIGVSVEGARFRASATINGKAVNLGRFDTIEAAAAARKAAVDANYDLPHKSLEHAFNAVAEEIAKGTSVPMFAT